MADDIVESAGAGDLDTTDAPEDLPPPERLAQAYHHVLVLARAVPARDLKPYRVDARLAFWNASEGHKRLVPHLGDVRTLPRTDIAAVERVPELAMGLLHAVRLIELLDPPKGDLNVRLARARQLRYVMLHQAQAAMGAGLLPEAPVEKIARGTSSIDSVEDLVALVTLFEQHQDALHGRTVVSPEMLLEAERLGLALQQELRPGVAPRSPKEKAESLAQAVGDRDRIWSLLAHSYSELTRVAGFLGVRVPGLQSRRVRKKAPAPAKS